MIERLPTGIDGLDSWIGGAFQEEASYYSLESLELARQSSAQVSSAEDDDSVSNGLLYS